jgi:hypothetical protein
MKHSLYVIREIQRRSEKMHMVAEQKERRGRQVCPLSFHKSGSWTDPCCRIYEG